MTADHPAAPEALPFRRVDKTWAVSVAEHLLWVYRGLPDPSLIIDDCWLTTEYAIYIRHVRGDKP